MKEMGKEVWFDVNEIEIGFEKTDCGHAAANRLSGSRPCITEALTLGPQASYEKCPGIVERTAPGHRITDKRLQKAVS
jgi:hypothetical protein